MLRIKEQYGLQASKIDTINNHLAITVNGTLTTRGEIVTGAGIAQWATERFEMFPSSIGIEVINKGNIPHAGVFNSRKHPGGHNIVTFPVKHNWWERANTGLIAMSMLHILRHWNYWGIKRLYVPFPGCGNGQLKWDEGPNMGVKHILMNFIRPSIPYVQGELVFFTHDENGTNQEVE